MIEIASAALGHAPQIARPAGVPDLAIEHERAAQIGHAKALAYAFPQVIRRGRQIDGLRYRQCVPDFAGCFDRGAWNGSDC